eukprot:gene1041-biopygen345
MVVVVGALRAVFDLVSQTLSKAYSEGNDAQDNSAEFPVPCTIRCHPFPFAVVRSLRSPLRSAPASQQLQINSVPVLSNCTHRSDGAFAVADAWCRSDRCEAPRPPHAHTLSRSVRRDELRPKRGYLLFQTQRRAYFDSPLPYPLLRLCRPPLHCHYTLPYS